MSSPDFFYEKRLWKNGYKFIAGTDEVGRGCFAGPVVAAAVVLRPQISKSLSAQAGKFQIPKEIRINDSKKLTPEQRGISAKWIKKNALAYGIGSISAKVINRIGMGKATQMAFRKAIASANKRFEQTYTSSIQFLLIDAFFIPFVKGFPRGSRYIKGDGMLKGPNAKQLAIINGDEKSLSIAGASIIAKVSRDNLMQKIGLRTKYKKYKWYKNKGYATQEHTAAILKYGITGYHRKKFVETFLGKLKI